MFQRQRSFLELEYAQKKNQTRRDRFLQELEAFVPWSVLEQVIAPFYPTTGRRGRPPVGVTRMLRMYVAQQCFWLSDEGIEEAIYDSQAIRRFVGIDLSRESAPDATTLPDFRHLLEAHQLTESTFNAIAHHLATKGLMLRRGTIVDATLIAAPPSTKNQVGKRDPAMHQSKKGNQWYFGMKAHIGVDAHFGLVHTVIGTAGNVSDISQAQALLHGKEEVAFGDAGYQGVEKLPESAEATVAWHVAENPSKVKTLAGTALGDLVAQVEHPFHVVKNLFKHKKTRYKGLAKNTAQLLTLFGLANLVLALRWLLAADGQVAS
ncbi:MAG: IS5 family transposase [Dechloromonas sp.]|nr:IS5 family transposase [Dechloromonas sp.]